MHPFCVFLGSLLLSFRSRSRVFKMRSKARSDAELFMSRT